MESYQYQSALAVVGLSTVVYLWTRKSSKYPLPPGPKPLPLLTNVFDVPQEYAHRTYLEWSRKYNSPLVHLNIFGDHLIIANTLKATEDLFEQRSAIYSDRPWLTMLGELVGADHWNPGFMSYSRESWRAARTHFQQTMGPGETRQWRHKDVDGAHECLRRLLVAPEDFGDHIKHSTGRTLLSVAYSIDVKPQNDPWVNLSEEWNRIVNVTIAPGAFLVDSLPILKYVPTWMAKFQRQAKEWRKVSENILHAPFDLAKEAMHSHAPPSVSSLLLERLEDEDCTPEERAAKELDCKRTTASMYGAGSDTTTSVLESFFLFMTACPDVQARARKELDEVVGTDRLPDFNDDLPYIHALTKELLRFHPVVPLALPHRLIQDDVYEGYFMPKGSLVFGNGWAILHDPAVYPDPDTFNPDRFLGPTPNSDPDATFGYGRRMCPGRYLAIDMLWIHIASIVATFDITMPLGENGEVVKPVVEYTPESMCHPKPFQCIIKPRSTAAVDLIKATQFEY